PACGRAGGDADGGGDMTTAVMSVYKVASFPDGGGHFWVYLQYALGLRRLGCDVYWLEQLRPARDPERQSYVISTFLERMQQLGFEGRTLLYTLDGDPRFIGCTRGEAEAVLRRADVLLNFHYAIDPRLLAGARRTTLVDIDPGLLQFWMSSGQLKVPPHDSYLTTGETVGTPAARFSDCLRRLSPSGSRSRRYNASSSGWLVWRGRSTKSRKDTRFVLSRSTVSPFRSTFNQLAEDQLETVVKASDRAS